MKLTNTDKAYKKENFITYSCQYHVVFCVRNNRKVLTGDKKDSLADIFKTVAHEKGFSILEIDIFPNYVHFIMECPPSLDPLSCVKKLKRGTYSLIMEQFSDLKKRLDGLWTKKSFISTAGTIELSDIVSFINGQKGY